VLVRRASTSQTDSFPNGGRRPRLHALPLVLLFVGALLSWGCKNEQQKRLSPARVHGITREMMRASSGFGKRPGDLASHLQFDGTHADRVDDLFVALPAASSEQAQRETVARLIQSLDGVATANNLTRDEPASSGALLRLDYRSAGVVTNSVHIVVPKPARSASASPREGEKNGTPRMAIILDDLGSDRAGADAIFALHYPLTISVLPNHAHSAEIAEEAHRRGYEVMLHLPMQSVGNETPEAHE
jgi:hypothetical protein